MKHIACYLRYDWPLHFVLLFTNWLPDNVFFMGIRGWLAHWFFGRCGKNLRLGRQVVFHNPINIEIGEDVFFAFGCLIMATDSIKIENQVMFGPYCVVVSGNHTRKQGSYRYGDAQLAPITIGYGSWLGSHVIVTAGSNIGSGSSIGAGAVVKGDLPENTVAAGVPARIVKTLEG